MSNNYLSKKHKAIKSIRPIALKSIICLDLMKVEQSQVTGVVTNWKMRYCFKFSFEVPQNGRKKIPCKLLPNWTQRYWRSWIRWSAAILTWRNKRNNFNENRVQFHMENIVHRNGLRFFVFFKQYGCHDVMWKGSAESFGIKRPNNTLYFLSICSLYSVPVNSQKNLTIGAYVPLTGSCWRGGFAVKTVIEWALEQVNERNDVLFGYQLNVVLNDTKVCKMDFENGLENELFMAQFVRLRIKS